MQQRSLTRPVVRRAAVAVALAVLWAAAPAAQQRPGGARPPFPAAPWERGVVNAGLPVSPFFEGWYENPDGSYTLSFGFFNRNRAETLVIPRGPENFLSPAEYDGGQPTLFPAGRGTGVFTVRVPGDFAENGGRVVWTLGTGAHPPHSVPGKVGVEAYRLHHAPMAMGSLPPRLRLQEDGPELWGPMTRPGDAREPAAWSGPDPIGALANPLALAASVGTPLTLTAWVGDRLAGGAERDPVPGGAAGFTHAGPAAAAFGEQRLRPTDATGRITTTVTFDRPGEYVLRIRADNFNPVDSTPADQCCWTNGYLRVVVRR